MGGSGEEVCGLRGGEDVGGEVEDDERDGV